MSIVDRLLGREQGPASRDEAQRASPTSSDEQALQRYRYLVRTAPPEAIEEAHREAFERLTPEQRVQLLHELNAGAPANERIGDPARSDSQTLARMATRAELRHPGTMERTMAGSGPGLGGMFASSLLGSVVGSVIGSAIAHQFMGGFPHAPGDIGRDETASHDAAADEGDTSGDDTDVGGSGDDPGGDFGDDIGSDF